MAYAPDAAAGAAGSSVETGVTSLWWCRWAVGDGVVASRFKVIGEMTRRFELSCCALLADASLWSDESLPPVRLAVTRRSFPFRRLLRSARNVSMSRLKLISPPESVMKEEEEEEALGVKEETDNAMSCAPCDPLGAEGITVAYGGGLGPALLIASGEPDRELAPPPVPCCW